MSKKEEFKLLLLQLANETKDQTTKEDLLNFADDLDFTFNAEKIYYKFSGYVQCLYSRRVIDDVYNISESMTINKIHELFEI